MDSSYTMMLDNIPPEVQIKTNVIPRFKDRDLDSFLNKVYLYYTNHGFYPLIIGEIIRLVIFLLIIFIGVFVTSFVEYHKLHVFAKSHGGVDQPLGNFLNFSPSRIHPLIWIITTIMMFFWGLNVVQFIRDIPELIYVKNFYQSFLKIEDVSTTDWNTVTTRLIQGPYDQLDPFIISARIMRRDNYTIAMFNHNVFDLPHTITEAVLSWRQPQWKFPLIYSKPVEWTLSYTLWSYIFENGLIRENVLRPEYHDYYVSKIKQRMRIFGIVFLFMSPVVFLYLLIYYICSYFEQMRSSNFLMSTRMWTRAALWKFREYNELSHYFNERINESYEPAKKYTETMPQPILSRIAYLIRFIMGAFLFLIFSLSLLSDDLLLRLTVFDRSMIYIFGIFGIILTTATALSKQEGSKKQCQKHLDNVSMHTHYRPASWENASHARAYNEFKNLFQYRFFVFTGNIIAIFLVPIWLTFILPKKASDIVDFIINYTTYTERTGHICSLAHFNNYQQYGNVRYGAQAPLVSPSVVGHHEHGGKIEKSVVTFSQNHPQWQAPEACQQMMDNIKSYLVSSSLVQSNSNPVQPDINTLSMSNYHHNHQGQHGIPGQHGQQIFEI